MNQGRDQQSESESLTMGNARLGLLGAYLAFSTLALAPLVIAGGLFYVLYFLPNARIAGARHWHEVPCEVLEVEFVGHSLEVRFRYQFQGEEYQSDRYDLMVGESGEDAWARDAFVRLKKNPLTVCYVNPDDPSEAVLDRDRRHPTIALLLPAIMATIGLGFILKMLFGMRRYHSAAKQLTAGDDQQIASPSGHSNQSYTEVNDFGTHQSDIANSPITGIVVCVLALGLLTTFFVVMDGIDFLQTLSYGDVEWTQVAGTVDWERDSGVSTLFGDVDEFQVRYSVDETEYTSRCFATKTPDEHAIEFDLERPWRGRIAGTTLHATPRLFLVFPIGLGFIVLLCLLGAVLRVILGPRMTNSMANS